MKFRKNAPAIDDCLLDRDCVAEALGMSPNAILVALHRGKFPLQPIRIGRRLRWRSSDVQRFIATGGAQA